ncbi:MAG: hypothetical protein K8T20_05330 [Planctomycetes bacterium]|nr:hypothetical protein [Planctomycetota bacterium]
MRLPLALFLLLPLAAAADTASRLGDLCEKGPSARRELLDLVREAKSSGDANGAVPLVEALIALADGRVLEASEYARLAADAVTIDFGDRERAQAAVAAGGVPAPATTRAQATHDLEDVLLSWGEEWEWRAKPDRARNAYTVAAALAGHLVKSSLSVDEALFWANARYRARHHLAGLALRNNDETEFRAQAALAEAAHAARTAIAAAPEPSTSEDWNRLIDSGPEALVRASIDPPDHVVRALLEAPKMFSGKTPAALLLAALDDRFGERSLPLRWDAALALAPHAKEIAASVRKWEQAFDHSPVALALLVRAGETSEIAEADLDDPWAARACSDENALERAFERLPKSKRVAVAFRLNDLRGEDEVDLGK